MSIETYLSFIILSLVVVVAPGPNVTLILATSALQGLRAGFMVLLGATVAQTIQVTLVAFGLVWLLQTYSTLFEILRYAGVVYLVYLGVQAWRSASKPQTSAPSNAEAMRKGFFVGLANPKSLAFFAAFFPQFIDPSAPTGPQFAILAASYVLLALLLDSAYAVAGGYGRKLFATAAARRRLGRASGVALIGGGLLLAGADRK